MALTIIDRNYSTRNHAAGNNFLLANAGSLVTEEIDVKVDYNFTSSADMQVQFLTLYSFRILGADLSTFGWTVGSTLNLTGIIDSGTAMALFSSLARTITSIVGDVITVSATLDPGATGLVLGAIMPMGAAGDAQNTSLVMVSSITTPESIDIYHNLVENASAGSPYSLFDGQVNRFVALEVDAMAVSDVIDMAQLGLKSGGSYITKTLTRLADSGGKRSYRIKFVYANPYLFLDTDFEVPSCYDAAKSLKPYYSIKAFPVTNNPNSALQLQDATVLGNVGFLLENYNQGLNDFTVTNLLLETTTGQTLAAIDYAQTTHVEATVSGPFNFSDFAEIQFHLIPEISTVKNKTDRQLDIISLSNCFVEVSPATVDSQAFGVAGATIAIDNAGITVGTLETVIAFDLIPSPEFTAYVEAMATDFRLYRLMITVESTGGTVNDNNSVTIPLLEGTLEKAPIVGGPFDGVVFNGFFNHSQPLSGVSSIVYDGCTEDDFAYVSRFNLVKGDLWKALRLDVQVVNDTTGEYFDLLTRTVPFSPYVTDLAGVIHVDFLEAINQNLDVPDRNKLEVKLTGTETVTDYEVQIVWSLMASWRYWIAQNNALLDFFDTALPHDGRNAEWMRYLEIAGFSLRVRCLMIDPADVAFYWGSNMLLQDYDDSAEITTIIKYYDSSDVEQTSLVQGQLMRIEALHTLTAGAWDVGNVWGWIAFRPFESEPARRISTVWDWTSQNTPLKPLTTETKAKLTYPSPDVAKVECLLDTTLINANNFTVVARIESPIYPTCATPIDYLFDAVIAGSNYDTDFVSVLEKFLDSGLDTTHANMCCPTCVMVRKSDLMEYELWAFGSAAKLALLALQLDGEYCCLDAYDDVQGCEATYDATMDLIYDGLSGDIPALKALVPSQSNFFAGNGMDKLKNRLFALTTDQAIRYDFLETMLTKGVVAWCREDGVKRIQEIA